MRTEVWIEVRDTEDKSKVLRALTNVFTPSTIREEVVDEKRYIVARGEGTHCLLKLYRLIREQEIHDAARENIRRGIRGNTVVFYLNKQAAYRGLVVFCTVPEKESPLGPITFIVTCSDVRRFLDWIAPKTLKGEVVYEAKPPEDP